MHRFLSCRGLDRVKNSARRAAENEVRRIESEFQKAEEEAEKEHEEIEKKLNEAYSQLKQMPVRGRPSRQKVELKTYIQALENQLEDLQMTEGIVQFAELSKKIARHRKNILNSVELQVNSSRSEAANTTIKSLIATTRGFRNLDNMFALIYRDVQT